MAAAPSYDDLRRDYKASLHREMQLRRKNQELEEVLLRTKGKFMQAIQEIDLSLEALARERHAHDVANDLTRMDNRNPLR